MEKNKIISCPHQCKQCGLLFEGIGNVALPTLSNFHGIKGSWYINVTPLQTVCKNLGLYKSLARWTGVDDNNKLTTRNTAIQYTIIAKLVVDCCEEEEMDKKIQILHKINSLLPKSCCVDIPSMAYRLVRAT